MQGSSSALDSYDFDVPLEGVTDKDTEENELDIRRSAMKKPGQSRSAQNSSMLLKVHFDVVHVREYGMVLGENPAVSHGAPVQLDWDPQEEHDPVPIDNYEKARSLWRAKDRRGFLMNAHKRVKILFAAGYTIDEIAKATMEMKELRQLRAESLKTQGLVTSVIMGLLSGAAETTGHTVRAVQIIPGAITGAGKVMVNGTASAVVGGGTAMVGLTSKVVNSTANAAKRSSTLVTDMASEGIKGTGKVVVGSANLLVKGTTGVATGMVKGTSSVVKGTGKVGMDVATGMVKGTSSVVKGTGSVMMGSTKAVAKGTGVLFAGVGRVGKVGLDMTTGTSRRISKMVVGSLDSSSHNERRQRMSNFNFGGLLGMDASTRSDMEGDDDEMESSRNSWLGVGAGLYASPRGRSSMPAPKSNSKIPKPTSLGRQVSLDSGRGHSVERGRSRRESAAQMNLSDELLEMQDFLVQLEGMDKATAQEILAQEQAKEKKRSKRRVATKMDNDDIPDASPIDDMPAMPPPPMPAQRAVSTSAASGGRSRRATTMASVPEQQQQQTSHSTGSYVPRKPGMAKRAQSAAVAPATRDNMQTIRDSMDDRAKTPPRSVSPPPPPSPAAGERTPPMPRKPGIAKRATSEAGSAGSRSNIQAVQKQDDLGASSMHVPKSPRPWFG